MKKPVWGREGSLSSVLLCWGEGEESTKHEVLRNQSFVTLQVVCVECKIYTLAAGTYYGRERRSGKR